MVPRKSELFGGVTRVQNLHVPRHSLHCQEKLSSSIVARRKDKVSNLIEEVLTINLGNVKITKNLKVAMIMPQLKWQSTHRWIKVQKLCDKPSSDQELNC